MSNPMRSCPHVEPHQVQAPSGKRQMFAFRNNRMLSKARELPLHKLKIPIVVFQVQLVVVVVMVLLFPPQTCDLYVLYDLYELYYLYDLHDLAHVAG